MRILSEATLLSALSESTTLKLYHGSSREITTFDSSRDNMHNNLIWFAKNQEYAKTFANHKGFLYECELKVNKIYEASKHWSLLTSLASKLHSFKSEYTSHYWYALESQASQDDLSIEDVWLYWLQIGHWETYEGASLVIKTILNLGFDCIQEVDESDQLIYGVTDPKLIKILTKKII